MKTASVSQSRMNTKQPLWRELQTNRLYLNTVEQKARAAKADALPEWQGLIERLKKRSAYLESLLCWESHDTHICTQD